MPLRTKILLIILLALIIMNRAHAEEACYYSDKVPEQAVSLVKYFEAFSPKAYYDHKGYSVGYGTQAPDVHAKTVWTEKKADKRLRIDLQKIYAKLNNELTVCLSVNQISGLLSFGYNLGANVFNKGDLIQLLNLGLIKQASDKLVKYNTASGKKVKGLVKRREIERVLLLTE